MSSKKCGERHNITGLSFSTASFSVGISLITVILNGLIIFVFIQNYKSLFRRLFYKITFNVILADLLNGLVADNLTLSYVIKEGMKDSIAEIHVTLSHITFFIFGTVSVITIGIIGIERQWAVLMPFSYRMGIRTRYVVVTMMFIWLVSIAMSLLYLWVGFYNSLVIFASTTVTLSFIILIITVSVYYFKLIRRPKIVASEEAIKTDRSQRSSTLYAFRTGTMTAKVHSTTRPIDHLATSPKATSSSTDSTSEVLDNKLHCTGDGNEQRIFSIVRLNSVRKSKNPMLESSRRPQNEKKQSQRYRSFATEVEKRATRTFMIVLIVYIISYLPTCIMMTYMKTCRSCDCLILHVLRDVTYLSMTSGCFLRPVSFIFTLTPIRNGIKRAYRRCAT